MKAFMICPRVVDRFQAKPIFYFILPACFATGRTILLRHWAVADSIAV